MDAFWLCVHVVDCDILAKILTTGTGDFKMRSVLIFATATANCCFWFLNALAAYRRNVNWLCLHTTDWMYIYIPWCHSWRPFCQMSCCSLRDPIRPVWCFSLFASTCFSFQSVHSILFREFCGWTLQSCPWCMSLVLDSNEPISSSAIHSPDLPFALPRHWSSWSSVWVEM